jgi:hypothetical protein
MQRSAVFSNQVEYTAVLYATCMQFELLFVHIYTFESQVTGSARVMCHAGCFDCLEVCRTATTVCTVNRSYLLCALLLIEHTHATQPRIVYMSV